MKTLQEEVFELIMNRIGVADDEEFEAKNFNEKVFRTYKFSKCKVYELSDSGDWYEIFTWYFLGKVFDNYEFKVKPFKPKIGDWYYYVNIFGELIYDEFKKFNTFDHLNRAMGNCFRTKEVAQIHKEEILKMLKIMKGENDE